MLLWFVLCLPLAAVSQHYHFIYLQGYNNQVFYVKKQGDVLSSSATGFIILPRLQPGIHLFTVGFPRNQFPEYEFRVELKSSDRGFSLKNLEDKGWVLLDMQTAEVVGGRKLDPPQAMIRIESQKSNDPFSVILASAVGDPGIRETSLVAMTASRTSPPLARNGNTAKPSGAVSSAPPAKAVVPPVNGVSRPDSAPSLASSETASPSNAGTGAPSGSAPAPSPSGNVPVSQLSAMPAGASVSDSVVNESLQASKADATALKAAEPASDNSTGLPKLMSGGPGAQIRKISEIKGWKTTELIFVDAGEGVADTITVLIDDVVASVDSGIVSSPGPVVSQNRSDCRDMGDEKDMMNLRKRVLRQQNEEEMLVLTLKEIKSRCYTVEMLQNMSYVFVSDRMRFRLFEEAYPYVFDPGSFGRLERLLTSDEYIARFRALVKSK